MNALVAYDSDSPSPPSKKRKLPTLPPSILQDVPIDDPTQHQGRSRSTPHVQGQFAAYIYVSVVLDPTLERLLSRVIADARKDVNTLVEIGLPQPGERELHISLSRPTYLRAHQREDLKRAVRSVAKRHSPFKASFATFSELTNDERTRTFLTMEIGAGHTELRALSDALTPTLRSIRQKEFYPHPRFHASFAWALLDTNTTSDTTASPKTMHSPSITPQFPTIPHLPPSLIPALNENHAPTLSSPKVSSFTIDEIFIKIGRDVCRWKLSG